ncbi:MAG TPA: FCD domain-containing protein [Bacillota bacterium]
MADQIKTLIENHSLQPGGRLPAERELASQLGVSRATVREAIQSLASLGYLEVRHGVGTLVSQHATTLEDPAYWVPWLSDHRTDVLALLDVREALEVKAAALAAEAVARQAPEVGPLLRAIEENVAQWERAAQDRDVDSLEHLDLEFHALIAEMSGNGYLLRLAKSINHVIFDRRAVLAVPGRAGRSLTEHVPIIEALRSADPVAASVAMAGHMGSLKATVRQL